MKLANKLTISAVAIMMMLMVSACGDDDYMEAQPVEPATEITEETIIDDTTATTDQVTDIGEAKAKEIVLAKVPGATENDIYEFEKEYDDGRIEYEGSLYYNGYEYEFDVDGTNGNLLKWEIDR